mmetsp:Transcript_23249/g.64549  ORF Transcript_23249/g.64549 Transcript_23249/m.64549 type:complete len:120 (+) Transcript_23249:201-560(+)|eukprot:CAMPEP_0117654610 /NCGR_PEP_ID=MMETSP0804-20121206/3835_1 /TAXON_ID=1074897 /ORGANISM="Tetraselmis astigmatica, Strain CCMP880" /LENGTH=119 /DNA_ID=CAMNT_0005460901 /DNA_START=156 /DNA_END=515 /DNA_ORIENTATION=+
MEDAAPVQPVLPPDSLTGQGSSAEPGQQPSFSSQLCKVQDKVVERLHNSTSSLMQFNQLSAAKYGQVSTEMVRNTELLQSLSRDMHTIFVRIHQLKRKLNDKYPELYQEAEEFHTSYRE